MSEENVGSESPTPKPEQLPAKKKLLAGESAIRRTLLVAGYTASIAIVMGATAERSEAFRYTRAPQGAVHQKQTDEQYIATPVSAKKPVVARSEQNDEKKSNRFAVVDSSGAAASVPTTATDVGEGGVAEPEPVEEGGHQDKIIHSDSPQHSDRSNHSDSGGAGHHDYVHTDRSYPHSDSTIPDSHQNHVDSPPTHTDAKGFGVSVEYAGVHVDLRLHIDSSTQHADSLTHSDTARHVDTPVRHIDSYTWVFSSD